MTTIARMIAPLALALGLASCVFHVDRAVPDDAVHFEPALIGIWASGDGTATVTREPGSTYRITFKDSAGPSSTLEARTGRFDDKLVLELTPVVEGDDWPLLRALVVVELNGDTLKTYMLDPQPLRAVTPGTAPPIPHLSRGSDQIILTQPTAELIPALREHLRRSGALGQPGRWQRVRQR